MEQLVLTGSGSEYGTALLVQVRKRTSLLQWLCLATLLFAESVELFFRAIHLAQIQQSDGFPLALISSIITQTNYGHIWLLRMILIALIMGLLYWTARLRKKRSSSESAQPTTSSGPQRHQPIK